MDLDNNLIEIATKFCKKYQTLVRKTDIRTEAFAGPTRHAFPAGIEPTFKV